MLSLQPRPTPLPDASAPRYFDELIQKAERAGATDVHLQMIGKRAEIAFRLDGLLVPAGSVSEDLAERVFGRIKFLAKLKTYQDSLPQEGRIDRQEISSQNDIRVATYPTVTGEKIVLRLFVHSRARSFDELLIPAAARRELEQFLRSPSGMLLLTGPSGSGKTTTIYASLKFLSELGGRHVITVEDPVEQIVPGIMQTEVNEARGLTFAKAAKHLLRQDPQALILGEIRDDETANLAVRAALTGHLVISTLHAGSCRGVFERMMMMCPDQYAVLSGVSLVLNQRLMRKTCVNCGGTGCEPCLNTGYLGRAPVIEWLKMGDEQRSRIRLEGLHAIKPHLSLKEAAQTWVDQGVSTAAELERLLGFDAGSANSFENKPAPPGRASES